MGGGKSKRLNAPLRRNASAALFPILRDLGVQAALTHKGALALHQNTQNASKEIKVVVKLEGNLTIERLCAAVVSRPGHGYHFKRQNQPSRLIFFSTDPQTEGKSCRVVFIQSGGSFPVILEDFNEIVYISEVPVLPIHAILLEQLIGRSRHANGNARPPGKGAARFMLQCLQASGRTPLRQLSPLWQSPEVLGQIARHVQTLPEAKTAWIAHGISPSVFALPPLQQALGEGANDGDDDDEESRSDSDTSGSERPPAVIRGPNVEIYERAQNHSPVTDIAARRVVSILEELGFECALSGSAASEVYSNGETRVPERLDIVVLPPASFSQNQAWLKQKVFQTDPSQFKLLLPRGHLFYKFPADLALPRSLQRNWDTKVEFLFPGTPGVPRLSSSDIVWIDDLPVIPFLTALLMRLEDWAGMAFKQDNTRDVKRLLSLVPNLPVSVFRPWRERKLMSAEFQIKSEIRVEKFCQSLRLTKPIWQMLGFEPEDII